MAAGHGGKRPGSGRKVNALTVRSRATAQRLEAKGETPLDIMVANMLHFQKLAESAEVALAELSAVAIAELQPEDQFKKLMAEVKKTVGLRESAQNCARDAAPYIHPRLTAISAPDGGPVQFERIERTIVDSPHSDSEGVSSAS